MDVYLLDKWGDGWNSAKLVVTVPKAKRTPKYGPRPNGGEELVTLTLSPFETSVLSVSTRDGTPPREEWEVLLCYFLKQYLYFDVLYVLRFHGVLL